MRAFSPAVPPSNRSAVVVGGGTTPTLLTDLIAYYRFNGDNTIAVDSSGNNRDMPIDSGYVVPGKINSALLQGYAQLPDPLSLPIGKELTISMWVNLGASIGDSVPAMRLYVSTETDQRRALVVHSRDETNVLLFADYVDSSEESYLVSYTKNTVNSDDQWIHVTLVVVKTGGMILYVDGSLVDTSLHSNEDFTLDYISVNTLPDGESKAGDIGIWNRALSQAEVTQLYNSGNGLDPTA